MKLSSLVAALSLSALLSMGASAQEIVIGQVAPLTGVLAGTGHDLVKGVKAYFESLNAKGGINGRKVRHVVKDDGYVTDATLKLTRDLLEKDQALALVGFVGTGNVGELVKQRVLADANIALVAPYTGADALRRPIVRNVFHIRAGYTEEIEAITAQLQKIGLTRIGVFYQDDPFGQAGLAAAEKAIGEQGGRIIVKASYPKNTVKVEAAVNTIAEAAPQAVIMVSISKSTAAFVKKFRDTGNIAPLYNVSVVNSIDMNRDVGDVMNGMGLTQVMPFPFVDQEAIVREYRAALKRHGAPGDEVSYAGLEGFIGAKVLAEGIRRAGPKPDREKVIQALETLRSYDVGGFTLSFSPTNHVGSRFVEVTMVGRNGQVLR